MPLSAANVRFFNSHITAPTPALWGGVGAVMCELKNRTFAADKGIVYILL
jgi:hypothetical protein